LSVAPIPPLFPCDGLVLGVFPEPAVPIVAPEVPPPPPEPPFIPFNNGEGPSDDPPPPPLEVIVEKIESLPLEPLALPEPAFPPLPIVIV
jgi:hypothetical protein